MERIEEVQCRPCTGVILAANNHHLVRRAQRKGDSRSIEWAEAARKYFNNHGPLVGTGYYKPPEKLGGDYKGAAVGTSPAFSFGSSVCECSVDIKTGKVRIDKFTDFHDCGRRGL